MHKLLLFCLGLLLTFGCGVFIVLQYSRPQLTVVSPLVSGVSKSSIIDTVQADTPAEPIPKLTFDTIFSEAVFPKYPDDLLIFATGDIIPARVTDARIRARGAFFPFVNIADTLRLADLVVANLEAPLLDNCPAHTHGMIFCGQTSFASAMSESNIKVATLENNHILNHGKVGKDTTLVKLNAAGVDSVLAQNPLIKTIKSVRLGFVAANGVGPRFNREQLADNIGTLRKQVDIVIVSVHWGQEYTYDPKAAAGIANDDPKEIGHFLIDVGADLVLGNHPHWVQGVELYKDGFISYAHGNFIFDQEWSRETTEGVIGSYLFRDKKLVHVSFLPISIRDYGQVNIASESDSLRILKQMRLSSERISDYSGL